MMHYDDLKSRGYVDDELLNRRSIDDATEAEWDALTVKDLREFTYGDPRDDIGIKYKYNEAELIRQFKEYVDATYGQHYSRDKFQATEFIIDGGHGTGFCIGNVLKYAQRYGKKGTSSDARKDLMKVLHYALIQLYIHDSENS